MLTMISVGTKMIGSRSRRSRLVAPRSWSAGSLISDDSDVPHFKPMRSSSQGNRPTSGLASGFRERVLEFCQYTSLHGWNFCFRDAQAPVFTLGWFVVIAASLVAAGYLVVINVGDFAQSAVSFNLESPTVPLTEVLFPSIVVCNMNLLRKSFVYSLQSDPSLSNVSYDVLQQTINKMFITGQEEEPTQQETDLVELIMNSQVYASLFDEFVTEALDNATRLVSDGEVTSWHSLWDTDLNNDTWDEVRRGRIVELAAQFREGETISQITFHGYGAYYEQGFATDVSETCLFLTPFLKRPGVIFDHRPPRERKGKTYGYIVNHRTIEKGVHNGANNGFQMLLDAEAFDYTSTISGSEGFLVSILHPLDIAIMKQTGINIETGQSIQIAVTPTLIDTTAACKRRFTPKRRQCYFEDEVELRHFPYHDDYRYEMANCLYESTLQKIERECGCTPVKYVDIVPEFSPCEGTAKKCMVRLTNELGGERLMMDRGETKECLAACQDQPHAFFVTQASFPNRQSFYSRPEFCVVLSKLVRSCSGDRRRSLDESMPRLCPDIELVSNANNVSCANIQANSLPGGINQTAQQNLSQAVLRVKEGVAKYARSNMAMVNVYIRDPYVKKYLTEEKITEISFVGTIGGILGLFLGFSFVSAIEVVFVAVFGNTRRKVSPSSEGSDSKTTTPAAVRNVYPPHYISHFDVTTVTQHK